MLCDDRSHVLHTRITHFYVITVCEFSVAVTIREVAFKQTKELSADVSGYILTPWGVVP